MDKKVIIGLIIALIAIIVVGYVALNFVSQDNKLDINVTGNMSNVSENSTLNVSDSIKDIESNITANNNTANNTAASTNATANGSSDIDPGDVLHKQTFTVTENQTGQNEGMEPGTYVMYYTENNGPIKIEKIA